MTHLEIHPEFRPLLEAGGLADFDALFAAGEADHVDGHQHRSVSRLELRAPDGRTVRLYLKRRWGRAAGRSWAELLHLGWPTTPAAREYRNTRRLLAAGVPVARPVAFGESRGPDGRRALLAFAEVQGPSLAAWLHHRGAGAALEPQAQRRRRLASALGRAVRRLHDAGFCYLDLYAKHVFLEGLETDEPRVVFIDAQRLRRFSRRRAVRDLAALYVTTLVPGVRPRDRVRFLRAYLGQERLGAAGRRLASAVGRMASRLAGRGRDPSLVPERQVAPPGMVPQAAERFAVVDGGRLRINEAFRPHLEAAGLVTLDALMRFGGGEPYRVVPGRATVRAELAAPGGAAVNVYIKRHTRVPWKTALRRLVSLGEPVSLAGGELRNIARLAERGIASMRCVAAGEEISRGGARERSVLVTEEIAGAVQADDYCEARFAGPLTPEAVREKRRLVRQMAHLARRLHGGGFVHRDFYLCHILVRPVAGAEPALHLIDLQRVSRRRARRPSPVGQGGAPKRWIVKDLAALVFSSWPSPATGIRSPVFTQTDRMRFACEYFGTRRLSRGEKRLLRRAVRKARRIARHERRRRARRAGKETP